MQKRLKNGEDDDFDDENGSGIWFWLGYIAGTLVISAITWLAWNILMPTFGLPRLGFIQIMAMMWLISQFLRMIKVKM